MENKKAQLNTLSASLITIIIAVVILVVGLVVVQEMREMDMVTSTQSLTLRNETLATVEDSTGEAFVAITGGYCRPTCTLISVHNASGGTALNAANYTTSERGCRILSTSDSEHNNSNWNVSYSFVSGDVACVAANDSLVGLASFADFVPLIVIAVAASVIIGLILIGFAFSRRER